MEETGTKTELDVLNEFLISLANAERVGYRRKIVVLNRFITAIMGRKHPTPNNDDTIKKEI